MSEASSVLTNAPHCLHYRLSSASCQHYGELYNYFIIYYNIIIIEIKCTRNVMCLNHPKTIPLPSPWKNSLPLNWSLVPKWLGATAVEDYPSAAGKLGCERWLLPRSWESPWDGHPSEGPWLHTGKNSRVSQSRVKTGLFREIHTP